jgi:uncharacterized membrane protein (UPF0182 family)
MEPTLDAALARLFGGSGAAPTAQPETTRTTAQPASPAPAGAAPDLSVVAAEATSHYERAIEAQRAGDWAKYGEEIRLLGEALKRLPTR